MIPNNLRPFFWDVDAASLDPRKYADYVIGRILEQGTEEAVAWMKATFREEEIKKVISEDRRLSPKSATYWALIYDISPERVAALAHETVSR